MNAGPDLIPPDVQFPILTQAETRRRSKPVYNARGHTLTPIADFVPQAGRDVEQSDVILERIDAKRVVTVDEVGFESGDPIQVNAEHEVAAARIRDAATSVESGRTEIVFAAPPTDGGPPSDGYTRLELLAAAKKSKFARLRAIGMWTDSVVELATHPNGQTKYVLVMPELLPAPPDADFGVPDELRDLVDRAISGEWEEFDEPFDMAAAIANFPVPDVRVGGQEGVGYGQGEEMELDEGEEEDEEEDDEDEDEDGIWDFDDDEMCF